MSRLVKLLAAVVSIAAIFFGIRLLFDGGRPSLEQRFLAARESLQSGRTAGVREALEELKAAPGQSERFHSLLAALLLAGNRPEEALAELNAVDENGPLRRYYLIDTAQALHQLGRSAEAEQFLLSYTREFPGDPLGFRWLGVVYYDLGAYEHAIRALARVGELDPNDYRPYRLMAQMRMDFEDFSAAIEFLDEALRRSPPEEIANASRLQLAEAQIALRDFEAARTALREAPPNADSRALLAQCELNEGNLASAREHLEAALSSDPGNRTALLTLADLEAGTGNDAEAVEIYRSLLARDPHDLDSRYQYALLLRQLGQEAESERHMRKWEEGNELLTELSELNKSAIASPRDPDVRERLAEVCRQLGKDELAEMWQSAADALRGAAGRSDDNTGVMVVPPAN